MIASLAGRVERSSPGEVVVDVGGVGYRVHVPLSTYAALPGVGRECRLRVVTAVREDEIRLFGFATAEEEDLFGLLQGVTGVGPKLALKVLSGVNTSNLRNALAQGDMAVLTSVPGVGKRLAERLVVELRDKVGPAFPVSAAAPGEGREEAEALEALAALGYAPKVARRALEGARKSGATALEDLVREALRGLAGKRS